MGFLSKLVSFVTSTGPRGGKKFINSKGHEEYGTPPKPKAAKPKAAPVAKAPKPKAAPRPVAASRNPKLAKLKEAEVAARVNQAADRAKAGIGVPACIARLKPAQQKALMDAGFGPLLHKYPARFIETTDRAGRGFYSPAEGAVRFSASPAETKTTYDRVNDKMRKDVVPYKLNEPHEPPAQFTVRHDEHATLIHEVAHHLHFKLIDRYAAEAGREITPAERMNIGHGGAYAAEPRPTPASIASKALVNRISEAHQLGAYAVSKYGRSDAMERFAEGHTAYVGGKAEFKKLRPEEYALIRDVRLHMGMPE